RLRPQARVLDLRLQARQVLAVRPERPGAGARQRGGARAEGEAREGAPDRGRPVEVVRGLRRAGLGAAAGALVLIGAAGSAVSPPLREPSSSARFPPGRWEAGCRLTSMCHPGTRTRTRAIR